jgi:hypothetical protein
MILQGAHVAIESKIHKNRVLMNLEGFNNDSINDSTSAIENRARRSHP